MGTSLNWSEKLFVKEKKQFYLHTVHVAGMDVPLLEHFQQRLIIVPER